MKKLQKEHLVLFILIVLSVITMIFYGSRKEGYHVDEIYSYGLANSEYLPFMHFGESGYDVKDWMLEYGAGESFADLICNLAKDFQILKECGFQFRESEIYQAYLTAQANSSDTRTTTWVSGRDYWNYLAVSASNTFNYASVYYNQRGDVHPPLYYMVPHTICSIFRNTFSPWYGLAVNLLFLVMTLLLLYRMVSRYLGGKTAALVTVCVYGFSNGFMTCAMLLRMYGMLTFFTVACCYVHLQIASEDFRLRGKNRWKLGLVVLGGFLTHYYFVLYAIGIAAVFTVWMAVRRKGREIASYLLTLAGTAAIGLCIWPFAIKHIFLGYRGQESLSVITSGEFSLFRLLRMTEQISGQLMGGKGWIPVLCLVLSLSVCIWKKGKNMPVAKGLLVMVPVVLYTVTVSQIVPFLVERYVMCTFPFWYVFLVSSTALVVREFPGKKWKTWTLAMEGAALLLLNNCYLHPPGYLSPHGQMTVKLPENTYCVYVLPDNDWNESAVDTTILAQCESVAVVYLSSLDCLKDSYEYEPGDVLMVSIQKEMDVEAVLQKVKMVLGIENLPELSRSCGDVAARIFFALEP